MITIHFDINTEERDKCQQFALTSVNTNIDKYKERGQTNVDNIVRQIRQGKLVEYAISYWLKVDLQIPCSNPDIKIYNKNQKKFDVDLSCELGPINVKTFQTNDYYPASWLFQKEDKLLSGCSPIELIALTEVNKNETKVIMHGFTLLKPLIKYLKLPVKRELQSNKTVLYLKDITREQDLWLQQIYTKL
jgi:hypothetical protein